MRFCGTFQVIFQKNNSQNIQLRNCKVSILWHFNLKTGDTTNIKKISKGILWSGEVYESPQHKYPGLTLKNQASLVAQLVKKNLPAMQETWIQSLGWEDPLEKGKATHSSILAWRIPWTTLHGVTKSWTQLSDFHLTSFVQISYSTTLWTISISNKKAIWFLYFGHFFLMDLSPQKYIIFGS